MKRNGRNAARLAGGLLAVGLFGGASSCGGPGNPGNFEGVWTGTAMVDLTQSQPTMATQNASSPATVTVFGSRVAGVDFVVRVDQDDCLFNFMRMGDSATLVSGSSCTLSSTTMTTMGMGMTTTTGSTITLTGLTGTATVTGNSLMLNLGYSTAITREQMMMTTNATQMATLRFTGTRR